MKIKEAFPGNFERSSPIVRPETTLLTILYLLRMKGADVVPVTLMRQATGRGVYGCSVLFKTTQTGPAGFANLIRSPCLNASDELSLVSEEDEIDALLHAFKLKRLGFAFVHKADDPTKGSILSLSDVLSLFHSKTIRTGMTVEDVSSPIVSLPGETTLHDALGLMYRHSYRRIFLSGEDGCVFDRQIMDRIFSPLVLEGPDPEQMCRDLLARPLSEIEKTTPHAIDIKTPLPTAAAKLANAKGGCLMTDQHTLVTPWDAVMKPWLSGELKVG